MSSSVVCGAALRFAIGPGSTNGTGAGTRTGMNMPETRDGADVILLPSSTARCSTSAGAFVHFAPPPTSIPVPSLYSPCPSCTHSTLAPLAAHLLPSPFRPLGLSLPPHLAFTSHPPILLPCPRFTLHPRPSSPLATHTNPLPKPPTSRPRPAYLAACSGVSSITLGKILPPVERAREL
ncbi:hypothetical protein C8J57DRAFT_1524221 [Mycena rebaudengoi]|nr:hypothetical protein C8J57DRAFT_1524221 [Mycena rebaudengoi]